MNNIFSFVVAILIATTSDQLFGTWINPAGEQVSFVQTNSAVRIKWYFSSLGTGPVVLRGDVQVTGNNIRSYINTFPIVVGGKVCDTNKITFSSTFSRDDEYLLMTDCRLTFVFNCGSGLQYANNECDGRWE